MPECKVGIQIQVTLLPSNKITKNPFALTFYTVYTKHPAIIKLFVTFKISAYSVNLVLLSLEVDFGVTPWCVNSLKYM